jgi:hypothetical protein
MATTINKDISPDGDCLKHDYNNISDKDMTSIRKKIRVFRKKHALRAFLKRAYLFIITAMLM